MSTSYPPDAHRLKHSEDEYQFLLSGEGKCPLRLKDDGNVVVAAAGYRPRRSLPQESDVCENGFGWSLPVAKIDCPLMIASSVLVQSDE